MEPVCVNCTDHYDFVLRKDRFRGCRNPHVKIPEGKYPEPFTSFPHRPAGCFQPDPAKVEAEKARKHKELLKMPYPKHKSAEDSFTAEEIEIMEAHHWAMYKRQEKEWWPKT
jgi:hypothetical protein